MAVFVLLLVFSIPLIAVLSKSEVGLAIADAIRHNSGAAKGGAKRREFEEMQMEMEQMRAELDEVHHQLNEAAERLDFAERLLSASRPDAAPPQRDDATERGVAL